MASQERAFGAFWSYQRFEKTWGAIKELQIEFTNWHLHFTHGVWGRSHGVFSESPNLVAPCRCQLLKATSYVMPHLLHANPSSCWSVIFAILKGSKPTTLYNIHVEIARESDISWQIWTWYLLIWTFDFPSIVWWMLEVFGTRRIYGGAVLSFVSSSPESEEFYHRDAEPFV